jgi:HK97 family phage portal protein
MAEFQVYRRDPLHQDGKRPVLVDDPPEMGALGPKPYDLVKLLNNPNKKDSFGEMMYRWNQQMDLTGKALTMIVPNMLGTPMELYVIPTAHAIPQPVINPEFPDGYYRIQPMYPYGPFSTYPTPQTSVGAPVPAEWMMSFEYPHPLLRYEGFSPLTALRLHIDEVEAIDKSRWYSMKQVFNPTAILNFANMDSASPLPEEEIERIRADLEANHFGPENVGRLLVSTPGAELEQFGTRAADMEYQAGWDQLVSFIMAGFGISKTAAGMVEGASYSNLFAALKQFYWLTMDPKCKRFASQMTRYLCPHFGKDLFIEINSRPINDHEIVHAKIGLGLQAMCLTKNEVRKLLELPTTQEEWGKEIAGMPPMTGPDGMPLDPNTGAPMQPGMEGNAEDVMQDQIPADPMGENPNELARPGHPLPLDALIYGAGDREPPASEQFRPRSGAIAKGALGPRKSLNGHANGRLNSFHKG